jgi:hypothetical protein
MAGLYHMAPYLFSSVFTYKTCHSFFIALEKT